MKDTEKKEFISVDLASFLAQVGLAIMEHGEPIFVVGNTGRSILLLPVLALFDKPYMNRLLKNNLSTKKVIFYACSMDELRQFFPGNIEDYRSVDANPASRISLLTQFFDIYRVLKPTACHVIFCGEWTNLLAYKMLVDGGFILSDVPRAYAANYLKSMETFMQDKLDAFCGFSNSVMHKSMLASFVQQLRLREAGGYRGSTNVGYNGSDLVT